jgi:hypothetical protein
VELREYPKLLTVIDEKFPKSSGRDGIERARAAVVVDVVVVVVDKVVAEVVGQVAEETVVAVV